MLMKSVLWGSFSSALFCKTRHHSREYRINRSPQVDQYTTPSLYITASQTPTVIMQSTLILISLCILALAGLGLTRPVKDLSTLNAEVEESTFAVMEGPGGT